MNRKVKILAVDFLIGAILKDLINSLVKHRFKVIIFLPQRYSGTFAEIGGVLLYHSNYLATGTGFRLQPFRERNGICHNRVNAPSQKVEISLPLGWITP